MTVALIKPSNIQPASFLRSVSAKKRYDLQTNLVIKLLQKSIEAKSPVTLNDIIDCYLDFVFRNGSSVERSSYRVTNWQERDRRQYFTREELKAKKWYIEDESLNWFKKNLGAAIIKGKILAIPIIEIE